MTQVKDPLLNVVTVAYDSAERVGTITPPDLATEEFTAYQEQGWTNSGTSASPTAGDARWPPPLPQLHRPQR